MNYSCLPTIKFDLLLSKCSALCPMNSSSRTLVKKSLRLSASDVKTAKVLSESKLSTSSRECGISRITTCPFPPFKPALTISESEQAAAIEAFSWIPSALLSAVYTNDRELVSALYKEFYTLLVPLSTSNDTARTRRLLIFASQLDERAKAVFLTFPTRQTQYEPYFTSYISVAEKYNGGVVEGGDASEVEKKVDGFCNSIAINLWGGGDVSVQRKADLKKWAVGNDRRGFKLLRDLIDQEKDFKAWRKSQVAFTLLRRLTFQKEVLQRVEEVAPSLVPTFTSFIHLCTLTLWNKTILEALVAALSDAEMPSSSRKMAHLLLKTLATSHPNLFKTVAPTLADWIIAESALISDNRSREDVEAAEDVLKALARLSGLDFSGKQGKDFVEALKKFALEGESERQGRRATAILLKLKRSNLYAEELVQVTDHFHLLFLMQAIVPSLKFESPHLVNRLGSLSKLMTLAASFVENHADDIVDTCIKDILVQCHDPSEGGEDWIEDADLGKECRAKVHTLENL